MSKKKKHQKQVNNEPAQVGERVRRPGKLSENTVTFDAMFSSALQQMLDVQEDEKQKKADEALVVELPERHRHHREKERQYEPEEDDAPIRTDRRVEGADFDIFASDVPDDDMALDLMPEEDLPSAAGFGEEDYAPEEDFAPAEEFFDEDYDAADDFQEEIYAPEEDYAPEDDNAPAEDFREPDDAAEELTDADEREFSFAPEQEPRETLPEVFTVPAAEHTPAAPAAPERFVVPELNSSQKLYGVPEYLDAKLADDTEEPEQPPEVFRVPLDRTDEKPAAPEYLSVPQLTDEPERFAAPEVFSLAQPPVQEAQELPKQLPEPEPAEKKQRRPFSFFRRQKQTPEEPVQEQAAPEEPTPEMLQRNEADLAREDTATLLSVIQTLIGSEDDSAPETPEQPAAEEAPVLQPEPVSTQPTVRFTPVTAAKPAPEPKPEPAPTPAPTQDASAPVDFWEEFEELKALVSTPLPTEAPAAEAPETPQTPETTADAQTPEETPAAPAILPQPAAPQRRKRKNRHHRRLAQEDRETPSEETPDETHEAETSPVQPPEDIVKEAPAATAATTETIPASFAAAENEAPEAKPELPAKPETPAEPETFTEPEPAAKPERPIRQPKRHERAERKPESPAAPQASVDEPVIIPSASVKPSKPRLLQREKPAQADRPVQSAERPVRRKSVPEEQAVLRPEEAGKLANKSLGTTGTRLLLAAVTEVFALFLTVYGSFGWSFLPQKNGVAVTAYILLALLLITAGLAADIFAEAVQKLRQPQFTAPLLVLLAIFAVSIDTLQAAAAERIPFCAAAGLLPVFLLWDKYDGLMGVLTTLRVLTGAKEPTGIVEVNDVMKGRVGLSRADGSVENFMQNLGQTPPTDKLMQIYVPTAAAVCLIASAVIAAKSGAAFLWTLSLLLLGSIPLIGLLNFSRLFCILAKRLSDFDAALCGWYGAETFGGDHSILAGDSDLFPQKNIKLNGIKMLTKDADRVVGYATATLKVTGSALYPAFEEELQSRNARRFRVERYRFYEGGVGAEIAGDVVLLGTIDFMKRMGVHMEGGMKLRQAVYASVNGELGAVFAIKLTPKDSVRRGLAAIAENRHFRTIFVTRDFLLTPELISEKYEITLHNTVYPPIKERIRLSETERKEKGKQGALMADDSFGAFAEAAAGGRILKSAVRIAMILTLFNGIAEYPYLDVGA